MSTCEVTLKKKENQIVCSNAYLKKSNMFKAFSEKHTFIFCGMFQKEVQCCQELVPNCYHRKPDIDEMMKRKKYDE